MFGIADQLCLSRLDCIPSPTILEDEDSWAEILSSLKSSGKFLLISSGQSFAAYFEQ